jgi:hypothetical protein
MVIGEAGHKINYTYNIQTQDATQKYYKCYMVMNNNNNVIKIKHGTHNMRYNINELQ